MLGFGLGYALHWARNYRYGSGLGTGTLLDALLAAFARARYPLCERGERALALRTSRVVMVVERPTSSHNYTALLRTAEALGVQAVYVIQPPRLETGLEKRSALRKKNQWVDDQKELAKHIKYAKEAAARLTLVTFASTKECLSALQRDGRAVWVTDLSQKGNWNALLWE